MKRIRVAQETFYYESECSGWQACVEVAGKM